MIKDAVSCALNTTSPGGTFRDMGGTVFDFWGAEYALSRPVLFPNGYMNVNFVGGVLSALSSFQGASLLQIGDTTVDKGDAVQNLAIQSITLNGNGLVDVALNIVNGQYVNVGPAAMVYGFNEAGISLNGTGGCYVHHSWVGQFAPGADKSDPTATAIAMQRSQHVS